MYISPVLVGIRWGVGPWRSRWRCRAWTWREWSPSSARRSSTSREPASGNNTPLSGYFIRINIGSVFTELEEPGVPERLTFGKILSENRYKTFLCTGANLYARYR